MCKCSFQSHKKRGRSLLHKLIQLYANKSTVHWLSDRFFIEPPTNCMSVITLCDPIKRMIYCEYEAATYLRVPWVCRRRRVETCSASWSWGRSWFASGSCSHTWPAGPATLACSPQPHGNTSSARSGPCSTCSQSEMEDANILLLNNMLIVSKI